MKSKSLFSKYNREISLIIAFVSMTIIFGLIDSIYVSKSNLMDIINQSTIYGLMGLGMTFIIISGGIDLSVGSGLALMGVIMAKISVSGVPPLLVCVIIIALGFLIGCLNGFVISHMRLQPFIATLGTMSVYRGLAYVLSDGKPVLNVPDELRRLVEGSVFGEIRVSIFIFIAVAIVFHIILKKTKFGNAVYAIGGNEEAARLSGVNVNINKMCIYGMGMLGTAFAVLVQIGKLGTGEPASAQGWEMNAIAAVAIGGASMAGGRGGILGTVLGAILFSGLKVGLIVSGVATFYQYIATGLVVIIAAYIEVFQNNLSKRKSVAATK